jgi:hypothetical protein
MVQISLLPLILDTEQFFSTDKILFVDVIDFGDAPRDLREIIKSERGGFVYNKRTYMPISLKGSSENLFLNLKKGLPLNFNGKYHSSFYFDGDLDAAIAQNKIYDFSQSYIIGDVEYVKEIDFLIDRYVLPYVKS